MTNLLFDVQVPWAGNSTIRNGAYVFLGLMALLVLASLLERYLLFKRAVRASREFAPRVAQALKNERWDEAQAMSQEPRFKPSHLARVVCAGLETHNKLLTKLPDNLVIKHMEEAMERETIWVHAEYSQGLARFEWIGSVAPFVGVLGSDPYSFASGILIAVPALWFASFMRAKLLRFETEMKGSASQVTTFVEEQMHNV